MHNARCLGDGNAHQLRTQSLEPLSLRLRSSCRFDSLASPSPDNISHLSGRRCNIVQRPRLNALLLRPPRAPSIVSDLAGSLCRRATPTLPLSLCHRHVLQLSGTHRAKQIFPAISGRNFPGQLRPNFLSVLAVRAFDLTHTFRANFNSFASDERSIDFEARLPIYTIFVNLNNIHICWGLKGELSKPPRSDTMNSPVYHRTEITNK